MSVQKPEDRAQPTTAMGSAFEDANNKQQQARNQQTPNQQRGQASAAPQIREVAGGVNRRWARPIGRATTGDLTQKFKTSLENSLKISLAGSPFVENFGIVALDNGAEKIRLSTLLVYFAVKHQDQDHVGVYLLPLEGSAPKIEARFNPQQGGQPIEIIQVAGDVVNDTLWQRATEYLRSQFGRNPNFHYAGALPLPTELSHEDEAHMHRVIYNATQALWTVLEADVLGSEEPISVANLREPGTFVTATLDYVPAPLDTAVGMPVRTDLSILLRQQSANSNTTNLNLHDQTTDLTRVDAHIDLVWHEEPTQWNQPAIPQKYLPRAVITGLDTQIDAITPEGVLLALSSATLLGHQMAWGATFLNQGTKRGEDDLRDIGAIGYTVPFNGQPAGQKIDTKSASFERSSLATLLGMSIHDRLMYSMDVPEHDELSWLHEMFYAAAVSQGVVDDAKRNSEAKATRAIISAADRLTGGRFSHFFQAAGGGPIAVNDNNRVHVGYWYNSRSQLRPLSDIDHLALLNLFGDKDLTVVQKWDASWVNFALTSEQRTQMRAEILRQVLGSPEFKGFANRISFTSNFITSLRAAVADAGLEVRANNLITDFSGNNARAVYDPTGIAVAANQGAGMFSFGATAAPNRGGNSQVFGRYG